LEYDDIPRLQIYLQLGSFVRRESELKSLHAYLNISTTECQRFWSDIIVYVYFNTFNWMGKHPYM